MSQLPQEEKNICSTRDIRPMSPRATSQMTANNEAGSHPLKKSDASASSSTQARSSTTSSAKGQHLQDWENIHAPTFNAMDLTQRALDELQEGIEADARTHQYHDEYKHCEETKDQCSCSEKDCQHEVRAWLCQYQESQAEAGRALYEQVTPNTSPNGFLFQSPMERFFDTRYQR